MSVGTRGLAKASQLAFVIAALSAGFESGCYKGLDGNAPFPCAVGSACPSGFACFPQGCVRIDGGVPITPGGGVDAGSIIGPCPGGNICPAGQICLASVGCVRIESCDPVRQNCTDSQLPKCTAVAQYFTDGGGMYVNQCVPVVGAPALDAGPDGYAACTRTSSSSGLNYGMDNCPKGSFCTNFGNGFACHKFCGTDHDCENGSGELCESDFTGGLCNTSCQIGASCGTGETCRPELDVSGVTEVPFCSIEGTKTEGQNCTSDNDCGKQMVCIGDDTDNYYCVPFCVPGQNSCPGGPTYCQQFYVSDTQLSNYGYCSCGINNSTCVAGTDCETFTAALYPECIAPGSGQTGTPCTLMTDCAAGLACSLTDRGAVCQESCTVNTGCSQTNGICLATDGGPDSPSFCGCSPTQNCAAGHQCIIDVVNNSNTPTPLAESYCGPPGTVDLAGDCSSANCLGGRICVTDSLGSFVCRDVCSAQIGRCSSGTCHLFDLGNQNTTFGYCD